VVIYDSDPRRDLSQLDSPRAVILRASWSTAGPDRRSAAPARSSTGRRRRDDL